MENGMVGKYVIVRCRDAGVHAGVLEAHEGRESAAYWSEYDVPLGIVDRMDAAIAKATGGKE